MGLSRKKLKMRLEGEVLGLEIACIGDPDVVSGMGLAGVSHLHIHTRLDETLTKLREFFQNPEVGLILVTHPVIRELGREISELRREKPIPLILTIPDKTGWKPEVDELKEMIRRSVGAEVVIRGGE